MATRLTSRHVSFRSRKYLDNTRPDIPNRHLKYQAIDHGAWLDLADEAAMNGSFLGEGYWDVHGT